jgi:hypothetical protein
MIYIFRINNFIIFIFQTEIDTIYLDSYILNLSPKIVVFGQN